MFTDVVAPAKQPAATLGKAYAEMELVIARLVWGVDFQRPGRTGGSSGVAQVPEGVCHVAEAAVACICEAQNVLSV